MPPKTAGVSYNPQNTAWLSRLSLSSSTELHDTAACARLIQTPINPSTSLPITDAQCSLPLYESSTNVSFHCTIGTTLIHGVINEKDRATGSCAAVTGTRNEPASILQQHSPDRHGRDREQYIMALN
jgi:hypothetical protein